MRARNETRRRLGVTLTGRGHLAVELGRVSLLELGLMLLALAEHLGFDLLERELLRLVLWLLVVALEVSLDVVQSPDCALFRDWS